MIDQTLATERDAVALCAQGIDKFVHWRADAMQSIDAAIAADDSYATPRIVKAWMLHGAGDAALAESIGTLIDEVQQRLPAPVSRDHQLLSALKFASGGNREAGAAILAQWLENNPTDSLMHLLLQEEYFWMGQFEHMRNVTERAAPAWLDDTDGYGAFLSLRSFANEEAGYLDSAERFGRMAVEIDPTDVWGAHAVAHVLLMKGEMRSGIEWLKSLCGQWQQANQMRHHLWWHMCLFLLEVGRYEQVLQLLTTEVRDPDSALVVAAPAATIDITNVASLLMRLELYGVDVGDHWHVLGDICAGRVANHGSAFSNTHDMMVLAATGQYRKANELLASMREQVLSQSGSLALSYSVVGIPVCEAVLAHRRKDYQRVIDVLGAVRGDLALMGASHAQRDVYYHLLVDAARKLGRSDLQGVYLDDIALLGFSNVSHRAAYAGACV